MLKKLILATFIFFIVAFLVYPASADYWTSDSDIITGLTTNGYAKPAIFYDSGTWKMIVGEGDGSFNGFDWNGTGWESNSSIVAGLGNIGGNAAPEVFYMDGTWYLISGEYGNAFNGFHWNGTSWISNSTIINGIHAVPIYGNGYTTPTVFNDSGTWKLISGEFMNVWHGYSWNGTGWESDSSVINGLTSSGYVVAPTVFYESGTWRIISGSWQGYIFGHYWSDSTWVPYTSIVNNLPADFGDHSGPESFSMDGTRYLIVGEASSVFNGFILNVAATPSNLKTEGVVDNLHVVTNVLSPEFSWTYSDPESEAQAYSQVQVGTTPGSSNMWDSGTVSGDNTFDIYDGSLLDMHTIYYVQVRTNDALSWSPWKTGIFTFGCNVSGILSNSSDVLEGEIVTIVGVDSDTTNATGYYSILVLANDVYTITVSKTGYNDYSDSVTVSGADVTKNITMIELTSATINYTGTVYHSQNTVLQTIDTTFDNVLAGSTEILTPSFNLTNSGNVDAAVDATFTSSYGGIYGLIDATVVIGGSNFSMQKDGGTYTSLNNIITDTAMTDIVLSDDTPYNWNIQATFPSGQGATTYTGTVQLTFSNE